MILSVSVTIFVSHPPVILFIFIATFCFPLHSLIMADLKPRLAHVAQVCKAIV